MGWTWEFEERHGSDNCININIINININFNDKTNKQTAREKRKPEHRVKGGIRGKTDRRVVEVDRRTDLQDTESVSHPRPGLSSAIHPREGKKEIHVSFILLLSSLCPFFLLLLRVFSRFRLSLVSFFFHFVVYISCMIVFVCLFVLSVFVEYCYLFLFTFVNLYFCSLFIIYINVPLHIPKPFT